MNRIACAGLLTVALVALSANATAQDANDWQNAFTGQPQLLTIEVGPNAVLATLHDITTSGDLAADARWAIDNLDRVGDGDGVVSAEEVVTFEVVASATINENLPNTFDHDMVKIDGKTPSSNSDEKAISLVTLSIDGAEGPVSSTDPITTDIKVKLLFDSVDQRLSSHGVEFTNVYGDFNGMRGEDAPPVEVRITAFSSWDIHGDSVNPAEAAENMEADTLSFTNADFAHFDNTGESLFFEIRGDPDVKVEDSSEGSPGVGFAALLSVLGLALVGLRRRS